MYFMLFYRGKRKYRAVYDRVLTVCFVTRESVIILVLPTVSPFEFKNVIQLKPRINACGATTFIRREML